MAHLGLHSSGHLSLHSSGHLGLESSHEGYSISTSSTPRYYGEANAYETVIFDDDFAANIIAYQVDRINTSMAAMASSGTGPAGVINSGYHPAGAQDYSIWANLAAGGIIYAVVAKGGDPFGVPKCDLVVTISGSNTGSAGSLNVVVGSGGTAPSGNPKEWTGSSTLSATTTIFDFEFSPYIWLGCYFTDPSSVTELVGASRSVTASLKMTNVRYYP